MSAKVEQEGIVLDENQVAALEKAKEEKQAHGEIETYYPGFLVAQDTYYVGYIKGVGHIYQQTVIDTYSKIGFAKLYDRKNALVAADMLNDRVIPFFEQHDLKLMRRKVLFRKNAHANFYRRNRCGKKVSTAKSGNDKTE